MTLPPEILARRRWKPGDELTFVETDMGILMKRRNPLHELRGLITNAKNDRYRDGRDNRSADKSEGFSPIELVASPR